MFTNTTERTIPYADENLNLFAYLATIAIFGFFYIREFDHHILFGASRNEGNYCDTTENNYKYFQEHSLP